MNVYGTVSFLVVLTLGVCMATESLLIEDYIQPSNKTDVEAYLIRYGYLSEREYNAAFTEEMTDALKKFQDFVQINITGKADEATLKVMSMPRCGVLDIIEPTDGRVAKWNTNKVTYKFINYTPRLSKGDIRTTIAKAFNIWQAASKLTFSENVASALIEIQFRSGAHGDGYHFDGKFGVLAHAFFPNRRPIGGDTHFDDAETWVINGGKGIDLLYIATHEFGHALGLPHSKNTKAVMTPYYSGYKPNLKLHRDDVEQIQRRYAIGFIYPLEEIRVFSGFKLLTYPCIFDEDFFKFQVFIIDEYSTYSRRQILKTMTKRNILAAC